jgi:hypothetical protein
MIRTQYKRNKETDNLVDVPPAKNENIHQGDDISKEHRIRKYGKGRLVVIWMAFLISITSTFFLIKDSTYVQNNGYRIKIQRSEFVLFVDWRDHTVTLVTKCDPKQNHGGTLYLWLEGDALVYIPLYQKQTQHNKWIVWNQWHGSIHLPLEQGQYQLNSIWTGCKDEIIHPEEDILFPLTALERRNKITTVHHNEMFDLFPQSVWIQWNVWKDRKDMMIETGTNASSTHQQQKPPLQLLDQDYIWMDPYAKTMSRIHHDNDSSFLFKEANLKSDTEFYEFHNLSNYELVCWIGSDSAKAYHSAFLSLRPHLFPHQRPFKFHLYPSFNFDQPDETWGNDTSDNGLKQRFRKCKHILVSLDEPKTPLSQCEYKEKITNFIHHLEMAFPDTTFPIWIFTTLESPLHSPNCHSECVYLPRSTNHPCNDVLKDLFASSPFSSRVELLDNTDISSAMIMHNNKPMRQIELQQIQYLVALRIFVIVGKKVKEWRSNEQEGRIDGLHRGNHVEPNFALVAYDWTAEWNNFEQNPID